MSKNYKRGRALEYKAMKHLRETGCTFVTRSAGSHSAADLIAVRGSKVLFIQVKAQGAPRKSDFNSLAQLRFLLPDCCDVLLFENVPYKGWRKYRMNKFFQGHEIISEP